MQKKILVTGAFGLVGTDLVLSLQQKHGEDNVLAIGRTKANSSFIGISEVADVRDSQRMDELIVKYHISEVYHLAGLLSAGGEKNPDLAWDINLNGLKVILDLAVKHKLKVFWPSSIAAFGPTTPKEQTPQHTILEPSTIYGATKVAGELLCQYYNIKYGLDVRSLRYPGLIAYKAEPGDGTTEYAVSIFYNALRNEPFECFLKENSILPMMYMDDAIRGTLALMEVNSEKLSVRTSYNFAAISFSPKEIFEEIKKHVPTFGISYKPDQRQKTADSWPRSIDDSSARQDWGWQHQYTLPKMVEEMLKQLKVKLNNV
ncbi:MAG: NAD-dependent epimerase/dehydratase family protein [Patescibacteria group bacterium]|jgi:nucleoside-diphosphate-sugar epimerase